MSFLDLKKTVARKRAALPLFIAVLAVIIVLAAKLSTSEPSGDPSLSENAQVKTAPNLIERVRTGDRPARLKSQVVNISQDRSAEKEEFQELEISLASEEALRTWLSNASIPDRFYHAVRGAVGEAASTGDFRAFSWIARYNSEGLKQVSYQMPGVTSTLGVLHDFQQKLHVADGFPESEKKQLGAKIMISTGREIARTKDLDVLNRIEDSYTKKELLASASRENPLTAMQLAEAIKSEEGRIELEVSAFNSFLAMDEKGAEDYLAAKDAGIAKDTMILSLIRRKISDGKPDLNDWITLINDPKLGASARALVDPLELKEPEGN